MELPFSGTPEMLNLWALTNIGIPGLFLYEISQDDSQTTITPAGNFEDFSNLSSAVNCPAPILPAVVAFGSSFDFTISDCILPFYDEIDLTVYGHVEAHFTPAYDLSLKQLTVTIVWHHEELVGVQIWVDGVRLDTLKAIYFYNPNNKGEVRRVILEGGIVSVEVYEEERNGTLCVDEEGWLIVYFGTFSPQFFFAKRVRFEEK